MNGPATIGPGTNGPASVGPATAGQAPVLHTTVPAVGVPAVRVGTGIGVWVRDLIISLAISAFVIIFLYQPVKVEGVSMMPSLEDQERIFVNKFVYRLEPIERGDIVVFRYPRDPSKSYIKRVIGIAGDHIRIDGGQVYVNDEALGEDYVPPAYTDSRSYPETTVPEHHYFVLGDHRSMSSDSREFGPVSQSLIYGKAVFGYWPMDKLGRVR
ncbi:MAG: signal peptidase I [Candidatus Sulfotelmatobacter sp.]|jgi:signal peptidase I